MERREALAVLGATAAGLTGLARTSVRADDKADAHEHDEHFATCAKACAACTLACESCFNHCAALVGEGKKDHAKTMRLCLDCAEVCAASAKLVSRHGPLMVTACEACAKACETCAAACDKFGSDKHMAACAKACRDCAKACKEMIKHAGHDN
jgi:hypothetical protein